MSTIMHFNCIIVLIVVCLCQIINRSIENKIRQLSEKFPVVIVTGPRQSGKTTLIISMFPGYRYESLEDTDTRLLAQSDPRRFLGFREKIVIDEVQRVPDLFSYIQTLSDSARAWLSVLEASYLIYLLVPHHASFNKRLVKMPKLYFTDTGLACSLLEIRNESQLGSHYMRGSLFESFAISEFLKARYNRGLRSNLFFWRDNKGSEIDCLIDNPPQITPVEIKSGSTFSTDFFRQINYWNKLSGNRPENSWVIYGGYTSRITTFGNLLKWDEVNRIPIV